MIDNIHYHLMENEMESFNEEDIRVFANELLYELPDYFFVVPASSSGKYHPVNDLGEGGLVRHSISVKKMLEYLLDLGVYGEFSDREKELLLLAALFHDCMKSGTQEEYDNNQHTKFLHPIYASNFIILKSAEHFFSYDDAKYIADAISSHMGKWNTSKNVDDGILPVPNTPAQKILHLADYLASRKDINIDITSE